MKQDETANSKQKVTPENGNADENGGGHARRLRPLLAMRPYLIKHTGMLWLALVALVLSAVATLAIPTAVRRMIDHGFAAHDGVLIDRYFAMLIVLGIVLAIASSARFYAVNWLGERVVADLRADVFKHMTRLGPAFFDHMHSGEIMSRLTADTTQIKSAAGSSLSQALRNSIMLVGALVMMIVTSFQLSLLVLVAIPAIVLPLVAYGRVVQKLSRKAQDTLAESSSYAAENLAAVRTMQAFGNESNVGARYAEAVETSFDAARERMRARAWLTMVAISLMFGSVVGVLWYGASSVISGEMSAGHLGQFVLYAVFAASALAGLSEVWGEINQAAGAAERLMELLAVVPEIRSPAKPVPLPRPLTGEVEFDNVRFAYRSRPDAPALKGITFKVGAGETIAVVGPSAAGKTTLFNLLLRFYDASSGEIRIDGVKVSDTDLDELRRAIAVVPQDVAIFADTVAGNIRYGTNGASLAQIKAAAGAAQADAFIRALPDGYDTVLGERGITLSGGQRQRIAIARAILKDAPILLLDEATSALDAENELLVQRALESVMRNRTTIVIAHRLATVQKADRILVMENGTIVEEGTHAELARRGGLYGRLAELQFGHEAAE